MKLKIAIQMKMIKRRKKMEEIFQTYPKSVLELEKSIYDIKNNKKNDKSNIEEKISKDGQLGN